ncbi:mechanosensitive ion channel protein MscS [Longibacter salinarum]|uniref:Mechanosensitive ion channel protein MscS n=1 Tax=Longibacter salinarum TaxID=1850348 RepID=A0A2A8D2X3_9BACT|nr:mechanosensitive ion channel domain-containing protein [Longibacter salinarum]PEN15240.1 mechanosensitive ion channel protein MscS [Longibacter salinarum]
MVMDFQQYVNAETLTLIGSYLLSGVGFLVVLFIGRYIAAKLRSTIRTKLDRPTVDQTLVKFGSNLTYYAIFILTAFAALEMVGVETASFIAVLAAAGFAVGLALQGTLANFAAGVMLLLFRPFNVGDYVEIGGEKGFVRDLQLFYTKLDTRDNQLLVVPNSDIFGNTIRNIFNYDHIRVDCAVGTDYPADIDSTREVLLQAAQKIDDRLEEHGEQAALLSLGDSAIIWEVRIWARPDDYFRLKQELTRVVKYELDNADIGIPYPQMDVHVDSLEEQAA